MKHFAPPHKPPLRIKISKIINKFNLPKCSLALAKLNSFNLKIIENTQSLPYVHQKVTASRNFSFGETKPTMKHYMNVEPFIPQYAEIESMLKKELTDDEILLVQKNKDYYLKDKTLRDNLHLFNYNTLIETLNKEDGSIEGSGITKEIMRDNRRMSTLLVNINEANNAAAKQKEELKEKEDDYEERRKVFNKVIDMEIAKDKLKRRQQMERIKQREIRLNKIYYQSRKELDNINKEVSKFTKKITTRENTIHQGSISAKEIGKNEKRGMTFMEIVIDDNKNSGNNYYTQGNNSINVNVNTFKRKAKRKRTEYKGKSNEEVIIKDLTQKIRQVYINKHNPTTSSTTNNNTNTNNTNTSIHKTKSKNIILPPINNNI